jgi:hypothetical protein
MLTWALSGVVAAPLLVRWGFRRTATLGTTLIVIGFTGLLLCAIFGAPRWLMTATLAITGFGFGPASMSFLISAQEAVTYTQRGMVTSAISFFRTRGGAVGIGLFGALFNILTARQMKQLETTGVKPADLLDPHARHTIAADLLAAAHHMIAGGLTWVFAGMLTVALVLWAVTRLMPGTRCEQPIAAGDTLDAA